MPGVTRHIYDREIVDIHAMWNKQLLAVAPTLDVKYTKENILNALKEYYPHEWQSVCYKKEYYDEKDKSIQKRKGKKRYNMASPDRLIEGNPKYKRLISRAYRAHYQECFNAQKREESEQNLRNERSPKIGKINKKIAAAKFYTQSVTPSFIDQLIGFYDRKNTTQKDKLYILIELEKYYNPKVIRFFFKINDIEINRQLRETAFFHLQLFNYQPRLRKQKYIAIHAKNPKHKQFLRNEYVKQVTSIANTPNELEYRLMAGKEQIIKKYDVFISHSSTNWEMVRKLIDYLNSQGQLAFCDWINDSNYLKRSLLCEATLRVIEYRLEKSNSLLFVESKESLTSIWCKYELNYYRKFGRPIHVINIDDIANDNYRILNYSVDRFLMNNYKKLLFQE